MSANERLKGLETFVAVADAGSFTAAAARLNLTNSAVGKAIARLEERLQKQLFERSTRKLEMTDAGAAFYQVCTRILDELEVAERALSAEEATPSGRLRINLPATFGRMKVLAPLLAFAAQHPQVTPHISYTDRFVDVVEDGMDVVVRIGGDEAWPAAVGYRHLGNEELIFCAAPAFIATHGAPERASDLPNYDAILYGRADGSTQPWRIQDGTAPLARQHINGRMVFGQAESQVAAVEAGLGLAQFPTWLVDQKIREGKLVNILPQLTTQGLPLHLLWQRSRQHAPKVQALLAHFEAALCINP
ncbi:LysR family transcriptional regulator [Pseudoduganella sp. FT25W]|uniref:LysR family transcriptional regulator n=1 Tax=Duganella alba TaxID=2666081 RepID=A0A6L5QDF8_9BURK|nr:LysR family transcriptional regulator [Duganella alba]MRX07786.1 LysR family transcriptional regulator [Duganella alba]MRX15389.1 LysR family transcriptional regulator [Duganella alba]